MLKKTISYTGGKNISTFDGSFTIEANRNRAATYGSDGKIIAANNADGITAYDDDKKVMMRAGVNPKDTARVTVIGTQGNDALDSL